jgi:acid phosphatase family membrane protein YuiD
VTVLKDLLSSKKFVAMLVAIAVFVAGRFGLDVDPATLDHVFAALLVFIGAQGIADHGKEAAKINGAMAMALSKPANDNLTAMDSTKAGAA